MDTISTPVAEESKSTDDYSDIASEHSGNEHEEKRRYRRGGRKESRSGSSKEEIDLLEGLENSPGDNSKSKPEKTGTPCPYCSGEPQIKEPSPKQSIPEPFDTGIRAFNIRKAAGGRRPVSVRAPSGRKKSQASSTKRTKKKKEQTTDDVEYQTDADESDSRTANDDNRSEEQEDPRAAKPMSIRLDLNLIVEVFLKAKIKGDVTITFLYVYYALFIYEGSIANTNRRE